MEGYFHSLYGFAAEIKFTGLIMLLWPIIFAEIPRYLLVGMVAVFTQARQLVWPLHTPDERRFLNGYSALIAGHNEEKVLRKCLATLQEQSQPPSEVIVVSDGSSDTTPKTLRELQSQGLIDSYYHTDLRGGKASALNLGHKYCTQKYILIIDCDTTLDRDLAEVILQEFKDPRVGAVSANIEVRNANASFISSIQKIDYLISITLGRFCMSMFNQLSCVSGACGMYSAAALDEVSGHNAGSGEDFDLTLRLREKGYKIHFRPDVSASTNVPVTMKMLILQRLRWEQDNAEIRLRRRAMTYVPGTGSFKKSELLHQVDFLIFGFLSVAIMPFYWLWIIANFKMAASFLFVIMTLSFMALDMLAMLLSMLLYNKPFELRWFLFVPAYTLYSQFILRPLRLHAYVSQMLYRSSFNDNFVPNKVRTQIFEMP